MSTNSRSGMAPQHLLPLVLCFLSFAIIAQISAAPAPAPAPAPVNISRLSSCLCSSNVRNFTVILPTSPYYYNLLNSSIRNLRFTGPTVAKPVAILLPTTKYQLQSCITCCRRSGLAIRLRSGGHSYEGLSYTADHDTAFVIVDLVNLNRVRVDSIASTAWVESGATLGEIYHSVAAESAGSLGFPAGSCSTVGSGGHIGGGGFGFLSRKFGLATDNVLDAILIDPNGRILNRVTMGEDIFWAIRGGGGGNWGAIYAWKLQLVPVPERVTVFTIRRLGPSRLVAELVHKWQYVAPELPGEFYLSTTISPNNGSVEASFSGQFLGPSSVAISLLTDQFPELGLTESDCSELSWIESVVRFAGLNTTEELKDRKSLSKSYFKAKSDYVRIPIPLTGLIGAFDLISMQPNAYIILDPYGGAMAQIESHSIPFPHRKGNLYSIQYMIDWTTEEEHMAENYTTWLRGFYKYMMPFVSMHPRAAYVNYVDLDLGCNGCTNVTADPRAWGERYFLKNYDRLVRAKTAIDPNNVFSNAQSIPPPSRL